MKKCEKVALTTGEIAELLDVHRKTAHKRLKTLEKSSDVRCDPMSHADAWYLAQGDPHIDSGHELAQTALTGRFYQPRGRIVQWLRAEFEHWMEFYAPLLLVFIPPLLMTVGILASILILPLTAEERGFAAAGFAILLVFLDWWVDILNNSRLRG